MAKKIDFDESVDRAVTYMCIASDKRLQKYDGAFFVGDTRMQDLGVLHKDVTFGALRPVFDIGHVVDVQCITVPDELDIGDTEDARHIVLSRQVCGLGANRIFRHAAKRTHWMARLDEAGIDANGDVVGSVDGEVYRLGGEWYGNVRLNDQMQARCEWFFPSLWAAASWSWVVRIGFLGHPSVSLLTTNDGARDVFRLRDIPNGASRRTALKHFVREHTRRSLRKEEPHTVSQHLRGAESFTWNGMACSIHPPLAGRSEHDRYVAMARRALAPADSARREET